MIKEQIEEKLKSEMSSVYIEVINESHEEKLNELNYVENPD